MIQVETYEQLEQLTDDSGNVAGECSSEAMELIESLGLDGQMELQTKPDTTPASTRFPYREMTLIERNVYRTLCPATDTLKAYKGGPIPLRVLQVAAHAQEFFDEIQVWSVRSTVVKDPVLVGLRQNTVESWRGPIYYMLARWGDVLEPLETLAKKAAKTLREDKMAAAQQIAIKVQSYLALLPVMPDSKVLADTSKPVAYHLD